MKKDTFLIVDITERISKNGNPYLNITGVTQQCKETFVFMQFNKRPIEISKVYEIGYQENNYGKIIESVTPSDLSPTLFTKSFCSQEEFIQHVEAVKAKIESLNSPYKEIVAEQFKTYGLYDENPSQNDILTNTAAIKHHHSHRFGLIAHINEVAAYALHLMPIFSASSPNRDLVLAGALLHDIGKFVTYGIDGNGIPIFTPIGNYINHLPFGLVELARNPLYNLYQREFVLLMEIIQSHHTLIEHGAIQTPQTVESLIVSQADMFSYYSEAFKHIPESQDRRVKIGDFYIMNPSHVDNVNSLRNMYSKIDELNIEYNHQQLGTQ